MAINKKLIHFKTKQNFDAEVANSNILDTSICFIKDTQEISTHGQLYKSVAWSVLTPPPALVGDIAYWDGSKVKTVSRDNWGTSLGTPVGVVVVPSGFAPDGKARMLSLNWASSSSTSSTSAEDIMWDFMFDDTSLTNYDRVPTTDNAGSTTTGSHDGGFLPSDDFHGTTSYVDSIAKYNGSTPYIPSPYLGDKPNPAYYAPISGYNNALADFDGKGNTDVLVGLGANYVAANAARNYKVAGAEEIEWYLPAAGELGYLMVRFGEIANALYAVRDSSSLYHHNYWSSSEYSSDSAYCVETYRGYVGGNDKSFNSYVRPFAIID